MLPTAWLSLPAVHLPSVAVSRDETLAAVRANFTGTDAEWERIYRLLRAVLYACGTETRYLERDELMAFGKHAAIAVDTLLREQGSRPVDALVYGSIARDYLEPATASEVATRAGLGEPLSYDVLGACAGMILATQDALGRMAIDPELNTVIISTAAMSAGRLNESIQNSEDVALYVAGLTVGNACTASFLTREKLDNGLPAGRIVGIFAKTFPQHYGLCSVPLTGPFRSEAAEMFKLAQHIPDALRATVRRASWSVSDVDLFVMHQASDRSLRTIAAQIGVQAERMPAIHGLYGNCESSSAAMTLRHLHNTGVLKPGMKVVLGSAAAGFMLASLALEWE